MLQEAHDRVGTALEKRDHGFRWRGKEISRIEGLSDAVFAFAITLLVVSLEPPKRFEELQQMIHGFLSFAICFATLLLIWHSQYLYFRRYALDDSKSFLLNAVLLFLVAFYVYPMRFLFTILVNGITRYQELDKNGVAIESIRTADFPQLMLVYGLGFIAIYAVFALLYLHAYKMRHALGLNALEELDTRNVVIEHTVMIGVGLISVTFALMKQSALSGLTYFLIAPCQTIIGARNGKRRRVMETSQATPQ